MISLIEPNLEDSNDGGFWMSFEDFIKYFQTVNVTRVKNWEEVRLKGKFLRVQDAGNKTNEIVLSKWYYTVEVKKQTHLIIGLHQEDERCAFV